MDQASEPALLSDEQIHRVDRPLTTSSSPPTTPLEEGTIVSAPSAASSAREEQDDDVLPTFRRRQLARFEATSRLAHEPGASALLRGYPQEMRDGVVGGSPRTRSPWAKSSGHLRSRSSGALPAKLTRAHSSPSIHTRKGIDIASPPAYSSSPTASVRSLPASPVRGSSMNGSARSCSPLRPSLALHAAEEGYLDAPSQRRGWWEVPPAVLPFEAIQEDSELDFNASSQLPSLHTLVPRSSSLRRRPVSPLHSVINAPQPMHPSHVASFVPSGEPCAHNTPTPPPTMHSGASSPALSAQKYNEAYPGLHHHLSSLSIASSYSSFPSTPTSARSRSPSISSLDTIEDAPDLESEAMEAERMERLQLVAEKSSRGSVEDDDGSRRRSSFDVPRGSGFNRGRSDQRKRWSISGGERRADLDLETIWED